MTKLDLAHFKKMYREIQVIHRYAAECMTTFLPFLISMAFVFGVSILYVLIGRNSVMGFMARGLLITIGSADIVGTRLALYCVCKFTDASKQFPLSWFGHTKLEKVDRCFLKSCQAMEIRVQCMFTIQSDTVLQFGQNGVQNVINLLITFPFS